MCDWIEDEDGTWETACGQLFQFLDGGPIENKFKFCYGCGQQINLVGHETQKMSDTEEIELRLTQDELCRLALAAHEEDLTLNAFIIAALEAELQELPSPQIQSDEDAIK